MHILAVKPLAQTRCDLHILHSECDEVEMALITQRDLSRTGIANWQKATFDDLAERLTPPSDFPCTFSQNAFRRELLEFSFIDAPGERGFQTGARDLLQYIANCRQWDGRLDSAKPLLMVFSEQAADFDSLEQYQEFGWQALQSWHENDPTPWPGDVPKMPSESFWSFCFGGVQLFVNMSAPLHKRRRSRNLGRHFTLVINPRERFDLVAGDTPEGERVRSKIRARSTAYDEVPHSPLLGRYQKGELEWIQYALSEDNLAKLSDCPFRTRD